MSVVKISPETCERLGLLPRSTVGEGRWVDLAEPIVVKNELRHDEWKSHLFVIRLTLRFSICFAGE